MFVCIFFGSSLDIIVIMADLHCKDMVVGGVRFALPKGEYRCTIRTICENVSSEPEFVFGCFLRILHLP